MATKKDKKPASLLAKNRKAFHDFEILESFEAGIQLLGTEVKSCRAGNISLNEAYAKIGNGEILLHGAHIAEYDHGNRNNHEPLRARRLLMHKREILRLAVQTRERGNTLVPLKFYLSHGKVKVEIGVAKGKNTHDKRESLRRKQDERDAKRVAARFNAR